MHKVQLLSHLHISNTFNVQQLMPYDEPEKESS